MTQEQPTIAALLTPLAPGAIAVVALAGPRTDEVLAKILRKPRDDHPLALTANRPTFCRIFDGETPLDDAVAVRIDDPTHPRAELCTHGGVRIAQRLLQLLEQLGARIVPAQDFCDAVALIHPIERDVDLALLRSPSRRLTQWLLSQRVILPPFMDRLAALTTAERNAFVRRSRAAIRLLQGLSIALMGPPNAGKSTLANRLIGRDRVITSDIPGTTRDWVSETAFIQGWPVTLTDTAGIRETDCAIETEAIARGRAQAHRADVVLMILDATTPAAEQHVIFERLTTLLPPETPRLIVLNKCDLSPSPFQGEGRGALDSPWRGDGLNTRGLPTHVISLSALTGFAIDALECQIAASFSLDGLSDSIPTGFLPSHVET
ncbi:MAG TPA: GTPase [Phycisphaerae bacterium]|nr:GTPase [Phycisphaerae bacterium]